MKLTSVKLTKADRTAREKGYAKIGPSRDEYPYGLCLTLDTATLKKLGLKSSSAKVGDEFVISAKAYVKSTHINEEVGRDSQSIELQIHSLGLEKQTRSLREAVENGVKDAKG